MARTNAALAAAAIRSQLRKSGLVARVRSEVYSGGSSITVDLTDPTPATLAKVKAFCEGYVYGHFDGMTDSYEYKKDRDDRPRVSYCFVEPHYSAELKQTAYSWMRSRLGEWSRFPVDYNEGRHCYTEGYGRCVQDQIWTLLNGSDQWSGAFWSSIKPRVAA